MHARYSTVALSATLFIVAAFGVATSNIVFAQNTSRAQNNDASPIQRLDIMRSRLETMRRLLGNALAAMNARDDNSKKNSSADDPRQRLRGLEQEASSILSDVNDLRGKAERSERYDASRLDQLEGSITDLNTRVDAGLRATASERAATATNSAADTTPVKGGKSKKKGKFLVGRLFGRGDKGGKYDELVTGAPVAGRDRVLFEDAAKEVRKGNQETGRDLFNTIITTYPDSPFLSLAKLAIADSFYLEGSSSALIQAAQSYQDWLTFFPTDPLADQVMLKIAESEMRQMGLSDRDITHSRKAEQRLKVLLQQYPQTKLRPEVEKRVKEVQENLAMHNLQIARFYNHKSDQGKGGLKGAQGRLREIVEKYPYFSYMDEVLFRLGALYLQEEEPDEAAKYFQQIARDWPNSEFADKASEQLKTIGVPVPDPDPIKVKQEAPPRPSFSEKIFREVLGTTQATVDKNGVLISKGKDSEGSDLIDQAIKNGGKLATTRTPDAVIQQRQTPVPQQRPTPPTTPGTTTTTAPDKTDTKSGVTFQPTQPGPPRDNGLSNPATPTTLSPAANAPGSATPPAKAPANNAPSTVAPATPKPDSTKP